MAQSHETPGSDGRLWQDSQTGSQQNSKCNRDNGSEEVFAQAQGRLATRRVDELRPHPSYARLGLKVPASKLNALIEQGQYAFVVPLTVTSDGIIIDGYARWEVARLQKRPTVECIEHDISEPEALHRLVLSHLPAPGLVPFNRIILALGLEDLFRQKARLHQQAGGKNKGSSKLTEAEKVDVRKEIAAVAGVSVGTLNHVRQLLRTADPAILQALRDGEIKIDRAWRWSKESRHMQRENLKSYRRHRGMDRTAEKLVANQLRRSRSNPSPKCVQESPSSNETVNRLASMAPELLKSVDVVFIKAPGKILALSHEIAQDLGLEGVFQSCRYKNQ